MKHIFIAIATVLLTATSIFAFKPKVDYQPSFFEVKDIEILDTCTRIRLALKNHPNYWVQLDPQVDHYIVADGDTTKKYKCIGAENLEFEKHIYVLESGEHEGVLIFEKVPKGAKLLDLSTEGDKPTNGIWGIHLDEEDPGYPEMIDPKKLLAEKSVEKWTGLDPDRYPDIPFYSEGGSTLIRGQINNYHPNYHFKTVTLSTFNYVNGKNNVNVCDINPDGSFDLNVKLDYPQYSYLEMGDHGQEVFLMPGDTLNIVTTTLTDYTNSKDGYLKYFGFRGKLDDAIMVNVLSDDIYSHFALQDCYDNFFLPNNAAADTIYANNERIYQFLDKTITNLQSYLGDLNASTFVKDILASFVIGNILECEEVNELHFRDANRPEFNIDSTGNIKISEFKSLDLKRLFAPKKKFNQIIYSNPIMICANMYLPNRWQFGDLFYASGAAACGSIDPYMIKKIEKLLPEQQSDDISSVMNISSFDLIKEIDADNYNKTGVGNCFAAQLSRVHSLLSHLDMIFTPKRKSLSRANKLVSNLSSHVDYPSLNKALFDAYAGFAEEVALSESNVAKKSEYSTLNADKNADVLTELIKPYLGNLIYIDFWGIGCGPCRSGMIAQKHILERFADKPFKALYVAEDTDLVRCNRFLEKEGIKGEHIYVSQDNWNRLRAYFNFSGIPFGVLIGKDGQLLKTHFLLDNPNGDKEIERHLK